MDQTIHHYASNIRYIYHVRDHYAETLDKVYNTEGYAQYANDSYRHYYYRKDHLGNNREVWSVANDSIVQRTQYYPSGLPWAEGLNPDYQNYKYNGKEFIEMHGYDTYDYGARGMYPAIMRFTTIDPLAEKYYSVSPYAYCANNPVNFIDPDGRFSTRFGAWWDRLWSGGGSEIRKNEYNQYYYVKSEQGEMQNEVVVTYVYGKDGVKGNSEQAQNASASGIAIGATMSGELVNTLGGAASKIGSTLSSIGPLVLGGAAILTFTSFTPAPTKEELEYYNSYLPPPKNLSGYPDAKRVPNKGRARWKTKDGDILEWDSQHGEVEIYDKQGKHKGSSKPDGTGRKPKVKGRTTSK